jgi:GT2 family glycosyltransferase
MKQIDIIMLTNTANNDIYRMTLDAVKSLRNSSDEDFFNIILVESNKDTTYEFPVDVYLRPEETFNYNIYLNQAAKHCICDYSAVSNNDVYFHRGWWEKLRDAMVKHNLDTASPRSPREQVGIIPQVEMKHRFTPNNKVVEGYMIAYHFCGWFWAMKKSVREWLFPLDEKFSFFYQDNDITMRLEEKESKHALVAASHVDHFGQSSHKILLESKQYYKHTFGLEKTFMEKWQHKFK